MAKYSNVVEYSIITDVDTSGVTKLQNELTKLKQSLKNEPKSFNRLGLNPEDIDKSIQKINQLQTALTKAFNAKIGTLDLSKLNASLQQEHSSLQMIARDWEQMGSRGKVAISSLSSALLSMNSNAVTINTTLSKMANTFGNTVRWGITAGIFQEMVSSVQGAVSYMKDLDESLTQIQMVTNSSKENMRELAQYANQAAQALGSTTVDYTNAVKVFVQEGFSEAESKQYANLSTKLANVSEQDTATTSDQITAYRNAFQLDYQQTVEAMDKVANVANNTASNVNELMTASQRSASVAQAVGATQDSFLASLATIQSVTRQTAEEIGNGMKTIYQRLADIRLGGETEDGVDYGKYANTLKQVGVDVLDAAGEFKGMDEIFKELMAAWKDMSRTQQIAVGETVAGKFQYNRFAALMNNADYYEKSLDATQNASGMMDQMNDYYMESIEGKLKTLQAAGEQVMSTLFDQDAVEPVLDNVIALVNGLNDMVEAAGGLNGVLTALSGVMLRTFSTQIAGTINNIASSFGLMIANTNNAKNFSNVAASLGLIGSSSQNGSLGQKLVSGVANNYDSLSIKSKEKLEQISKQIVALDETRLQLTQKQRAALQPIISTATKEMQLRQESGAALKQEINDLQKKYSAGKISTATYNEQLKLLQDEKKTLEQQTSQYAKAEQAAARLTQALENGETNISDQVKRVKDLARELQVAGFNAAELDNLIKEAEIAASNESNMGSVVDDMLETTDLESRINNVTKLIGSVTSLAFGFSMVSEAIKVCTDDSATLEEKISAVVMNGLMGITMAVPGIMDAAKAIKGLRAAHIAAASGAAIETAAETAGNAARTTRNILDAQWLLLKAPYIAAAAAIALAIAGIVLVIKNMTDEAAQANKEFERQKDILADVKKAYSDAKESIESLHNSIKSISDLQLSLEDMAKGTDEWTEATRQLNDEILNLLQTYPELAQYVNNSNGVLTIKQEGLDSFYDQQLEQSQHLGDMASLQQISTLDAENTKRIAEFSKEFNISTERIQEALDKGEHTLVDAAETHAGQINAAYAELSSKIETNSRSMEVLGSSIDNLEGSLKDYTPNNKSPEELTEEFIAQKNTARQKITEQFGKEQFAEGPGGQQSLGWSVDFSAMSDNQDLLDMISQATGQVIVDGVDTSWFDNTLKVITSTGEELEHSTEEWMEILANSEAVIAAHSEKVKENAGLFELFDAEMNEDKTGFIKKETNGSETKITKINSLEDLGVDPSIIQNIEAYQSGEYNEVLKSVDPNAVFEGSVEAFAQALIDGKQPLIDFTATLEENLNKLNDSHSLSDLDYDYDQAKTDNQSPELDENYQQQLQDLTDAAAEAFDLDAEKIIAQAKELREEYELTEGAARDLAIQNQRMNRGINDLADNWEKWEQILANSEDTSSDYADTVVELTHVIEDLTGTDNLELSSTFFESAENLDLLRQAAEGDLDAINNLGIAVGQDLVQAMDAFTAAEREAIANLDLLSASTEDQILANKIESFDQAKSIVSQGLYDLQAQLDNLGIGQDVYELLGGENWVNALNDMAIATGMSVEQMNNLLSSIGVQANVVVEHVPQEVEVPQYVTEEHIEPTQGMIIDEGDGKTREVKGYKKWTTTYISGYTKQQGYVDVAQISTDGSASRPTISYVGNGPVSYSSTPSGRSNLGSGGGGKSSSPKSSTPKETTPKEVKPKEYATSEWDYLTDITNDLERASAAMEKLTKLEDRLFGASRISNLQKLKQEYAGYISLLQQEVSLAKSHANRLRTQAYDENGNLTMNAYAGNAGVGYLHFDSKGNLENGREIELALLNKLNDATAAYNANRYDEDNSNWYSDRVDDAQKNYDGFMKAMQEYQDTLGKIEEGENQIQEYQQKIQDAADEIIDSIQEGIEGIIEAIDSQRDWDRMYRNWMEGGNSYSHFASDQKYYEEGLESLFSKTIGGNKSVIDLQLENLQNRIGDVKNVFDGDSSNADKEKLSEQAAQENLREAIDNLTDNIEKAVDYYDSLIETIEEASSKMNELIDSRLGEYDSIYDYLDTRLDQYKMLNSQEYAGQAQLYGKQIETNLQKLVDINTSIEAKQATVKSLEKLEASGKTLSTEEREALKEAREKVNALQKDQLETESKILSTVKNKLEAETRQSVKELQNAIMGGEDFEWAKQQWELASKMSSRYLDDYNRAYEVQKIQLQYQQLLNSTQETELATRQKITAEMNNQLKYLREKESLSAYDIQRAQGELELLQRKIALEEAYNNKSQMQLQRNAAGNYDFVYTADEDNVLSAMQALMEKEQELYNLSKSRQEELRQDFYDFVTEMGEMIIETATNMDIAAEERDIRVKEMLNSLSEYMITIDEETTMAQVDLYNSFVDASEIITEENVGKLQDVFDRMAEATAAIKEAIGNDLDGIQQHHSDTSDAIDQRTEDGFIKIQSGSNSTKSVLTDDLNKILENFDGTFNSIDATTSNSFANISNNMNSAYESVRKTSEDKLAKIDADTKLHMDSADTKIREVVTNVSTTIDEKTEHIKTKSIASTEEVQKAIDKASIDISTSVKNAERDTKEALKAAGDSFNTFVKSSINNATLRLAVLDATTRTFASDLRTLNSVISSCSSQISTWRNAISNAMYQANSFISSGNSLMQSLYNIGVQAGYATSDFYDLANAIQYAAACMADLNGMSYSSPSYSSYDYGGGGYGGGGGYSQEAYDAAYRIWMYGDPGGGGYWYDQGVSMYGQSLADEILSLFNSGYGYEWMDTGGYTGTWNVGESLRQSGGGKLAVLHQKELVLNPEDTENMLSAVSVVRDIVSGLNNVTKVPSSNLNRQSPIGDNIEQRVSINATFPGVSEAIEIKQALEQLADDAYQVANQYKY